MTTRRPSRRPATPFARRGVLLAAPTLLLAGCGMLPGGAPGTEDGGTADEPAEGETADGTASANPSSSAIVDLSPLEVTDEAVAGRLMSRLETSQTLLAPRVKATVTASGLVDSLTAADYTALTGEEPPAADGAEEGSAAEKILPGERKQFLLAAWESTDSEWQPAVFTSNSTTLDITHGGNRTNIHVPQAAEGDAERSGIVLAIVDRDPAPEAVALRAEIRDEVSEISLVDGSILATPSPSLHERELGVEVTDAGIVETTVDEGWTSGVMSVRGTVKSAFLTPYIDSHDHGGNLFWAAEDELHLVVNLDWQLDYAANVIDQTEAMLTLEDGTELRPAQDTDQIFYDSHGTHIATFTIPADERSATLTLSPRFTQVIDEDFEQVEDPITATLTFS